jgi:hypothetical protein
MMMAATITECGFTGHAHQEAIIAVHAKLKASSVDMIAHGSACKCLQTCRVMYHYALRYGHRKRLFQRVKGQPEMM